MCPHPPNELAAHSSHCRVLAPPAPVRSALQAQTQGSGKTSLISHPDIQLIPKEHGLSVRRGETAE